MMADGEEGLFELLCRVQSQRMDAQRSSTIAPSVDVLQIPSSQRSQLESAAAGRQQMQPLLTACLWYSHRGVKGVSAALRCLAEVVQQICPSTLRCSQAGSLLSVRALARAA